MRIPIILEYTDTVNSVCSYWRGRGPLSELVREGHINVTQGEWNNDWAIIRSCDIAFFQRPMSKNCLNQVMRCKDLGLKIWIDLDDNNQIPPWHEVYNLWCSEYEENTFKKIMLLADVVTVTNKVLQDYYLQYTNNIKIIPNAINDHWLIFNRQSNNKIIIWRGGNHHLPDLYEYKNEIIEVMGSHPDWKLYCLGCEAKFIQNKISNYEYKGDYNIHHYFGFITQTKPSIFIVPLPYNELNKSKSNISWQEATLCGATALLPSYWNLHNYGLLYDGKESFKNQFERLISDENLRERLYKNSYDKIQKEYVLSKVNNQRLEIIKNLMK